MVGVSGDGDNSADHGAAPAAASTSTGSTSAAGTTATTTTTATATAAATTASTTTTSTTPPAATPASGATARAPNVQVSGSWPDVARRVVELLSRDNGRLPAFTMNYRVQLKPLLDVDAELPAERRAATTAQPSLALAAPTPTPRVNVDADAVVMQNGPYNSRWLRVLRAPDTDDECRAFAALLDALQGSVAARGALYVTVRERCAWAGFFTATAAASMRFHHHDARLGELCYYRWLGDAPDAVPSWASSIEGASAIVFAPDERSVLAVEEYGMWKEPGGAVDAAEGSLATARREAFEETGVELDDDDAFVVLLGGWNLPRARQSTVNDNFHSFRFRARSTRLKVDGREIQRARFIDVDTLLDALRDGVAVDGIRVRYNNEVYSRHLMRCVRNHVDKHWFSVNSIDVGNVCPGSFFW